VKQHGGEKAASWGAGAAFCACGLKPGRADFLPERGPFDLIFFDARLIGIELIAGTDTAIIIANSRP
jgi:hypothetical protein